MGTGSSQRSSRSRRVSGPFVIVNIPRRQRLSGDWWSIRVPIGSMVHPCARMRTDATIDRRNASLPFLLHPRASVYPFSSHLPALLRSPLPIDELADSPGFPFPVSSPLLYPHDEIPFPARSFGSRQWLTSTLSPSIMVHRHFLLRFSSGNRRYIFLRPYLSLDSLSLFCPCVLTLTNVSLSIFLHHHQRIVLFRD